MQVRNILLSDIQPSALNPRKSFDQESLEELAQNIKVNGLIQPITVRKTPKGSEHKYEIVCGERRYRASIIAGMSGIDCIVKELDDKQAFAAMIIENLQRKDVDPIEEAASIGKLKEDAKMTDKQIAKSIGKSVQYIKCRLNLNLLIPEFMELFKDKKLCLYHVDEISKLTQDQQKLLYNTKFTGRYDFYSLYLDNLKSWIDECVMKYLDTARFDLLDESLGHKSCEGCMFNTKNRVDEYDDTRYRCMKPLCFNKKTLNYVLREAKESGLRCVYQGQNNDATVAYAGKEFGLEILDYTGREYVPEPIEPDKEKCGDADVYERRLQNIKNVKEIFDSNIADGTLEKVYEVCYDGKVSGEVKYAYNIPSGTEEKDFVSKVAEKELIGKYKSDIIKNREDRKKDLTELRREVLIRSDFSKNNQFLDKDEQIVFHALLMKFLSYEFKKKIGVEWRNNETTFLDNAENVESNMNRIKREFIKSMLSEKTVLFSSDMAGMLEVVVHAHMWDACKDEENDINSRHDKKEKDLQANIDNLLKRDEAEE